MLRNYLIYCVLVSLTLWLASGTLLPYAATLPNPLVDPLCSYLYNIDHFHFEYTFRFLNGESPEVWSKSIMIHRILFPLLSYIPVLFLGYVYGGFLTSLALHIASGCVFLRFVAQKYSVKAQLIAAVALATFPGVAYFGPSPYSYAIIVPATLLSFVMIAQLEECNPPLLASFRIGLGVGLLSVGYDQLIYTLLAGVILLLSKKDFRGACIYSISSLIIPIFCYLILSQYFNVSLFNRNSEIYSIIINSYLQLSGFFSSEHLGLLSRMPAILVHNFLFSGFLFLPAISFLVFITSWSRDRKSLSKNEIAWLYALLLVWLFNNVAPNYAGWQLRGEWIARLYEPLFVVQISFLSRALAGLPATGRQMAAIALIVGQSAVVFGPWLGLEKLSDRIYTQFYQHGATGAYVENLAKHGRFPLGTCPF